jgi:hypothetical protein
MSQSSTLHRSFVTVLIMGLAMGCADQPSAPRSGDPLKDLVRDTTSHTGPTEQSTPGYFRGTVCGQSAAGATDTMNTAPRIANVVVTIYSLGPKSTTDTLGVGPEVARTSTDASGQFQTPTLPGAFYIVTFTPPSGSPYHGVYVVAMAYTRSADLEWFIVLPKS